MELPPQKVEEFLHQRIPLAKVLNTKVVQCSHNSITLIAPKFVNTVELDLIYDGSSMIIGTFSCWSLLQVVLRRLDYAPDISLTKSEWRLTNGSLRDGDEVRAECSIPGDKEWQQFLRMLSRKAKSRISIQSEITIGGETHGILTCEYHAVDLDG